MVAKFTNWSNFVREAWLIKEKWNKPSCLKPPMNADARRCSVRLIGVNRRASAVPYPRRYEAHSLLIASDFIPQSVKNCSAGVSPAYKSLHFNGPSADWKPALRFFRSSHFPRAGRPCHEANVTCAGVSPVNDLRYEVLTGYTKITVGIKLPGQAKA